MTSNCAASNFQVEVFLDGIDEQSLKTIVFLNHKIEFLISHSHLSKINKSIFLIITLILTKTFN